MGDGREEKGRGSIIFQCAEIGLCWVVFSLGLGGGVKIACWHRRPRVECLAQRFAFSRVDDVGQALFHQSLLACTRPPVDFGIGSASLSPCSTGLLSRQQFLYSFALFIS